MNSEKNIEAYQRAIELSSVFERDYLKNKPVSNFTREEFESLLEKFNEDMRDKHGRYWDGYDSIGRPIKYLRDYGPYDYWEFEDTYEYFCNYEKNKLYN